MRDTNLPLEPNSFVGRQSDVEELADLLAATRMVTLCGPGGIGKTRLAVRVAGALTGHFPDGVWLVELADLLTAEGLSERLAGTLGVQSEGGHAIDDRLCAELAPGRALLLLDNCEHVVDAAARMARLLLSSCPDVRVLATSREPLRLPGETLWRVPPLTLPRAARDPLTLADASEQDDEAVRLFVDRATAARPDLAWTPAAFELAARICQELDGIPLAIELAAAMVRVLTLAEILERLGDRFRLLSGGDRTAPARQRTLRATVDWSYEMLTDQERRLLLRLTVFTGRWTLDLAESVCAGGGLSRDDILPIVCALVDKSLVLAEGEGGARYRLLETIKEYAGARLPDKEATELRRRLLGHVTELVDHFVRRLDPIGPLDWPSTRVIMIAMYGMRSNIWAAIEWALERGEPEPGVELIVKARWPILASDALDEADALLARLLASGGPIRDSVRAEALAVRGTFALIRADLVASAEFAQAVLRLSPLSPIAESSALVILAVASAEGGHDYLRRATVLADQSGDLCQQSQVLSIRAEIAMREGRLRESAECFATMVARSRAVDNQWAVAFALIGLARVELRRGELRHSRRLYEEAQGYLDGLPVPGELVRCHIGLSRIAIEEGDLPRARAHLAQALLLDGGHLLVTIEACAVLASREGDHRRAVLLAGAAAAARERSGTIHNAGAGARRERILGPARMALGTPLVDRLWAEGSALTPRQAADQTFAPVRIEPEAGGETPVSHGKPNGHTTPGLTTGSTSGVRSGLSPITAGNPLTARESEIAALIARGLGNRAIADELVISQATVARHVANILAKLGFSSRTQVAAWTIERRHEGESV
ncbi:hypothetical protein J5X84_09250 [Streptosporangiaceae bacterium NEAU-GS5]|nr:hypothetical protein [Streptosporangiaceae bacterium NEAU-GS5]